MRLVTYSQNGVVRTGAMLDDNNILDLNRATGGSVPTDMLSLLAGGDALLDEIRAALSAAQSAAKAGASATGLIRCRFRAFVSRRRSHVLARRSRSA